MRSVIISSCLLLLATLFVVFNIVYINNICTELLDFANELPNESPTNLSSYSTEFDSLSNNWHIAQKKFEMTIDNKKTEKAKEAFLEMKNFFSSNSKEDFLVSKDKFIYCIKQIQCLNAVSIKNIF